MGKFKEIDQQLRMLRCTLDNIAHLAEANQISLERTAQRIRELSNSISEIIPPDHKPHEPEQLEFKLNYD